MCCNNFIGNQYSTKLSECNQNCSQLLRGVEMHFSTKDNKNISLKEEDDDEKPNTSVGKEKPLTSVNTEKKEVILKKQLTKKNK